MAAIDEITVQTSTTRGHALRDSEELSPGSGPLQPREVRDVEELRALAHPMRQRILRWLRQAGPATSTTLATYLRRELGHRMRQAVVVALGLALGIGLVITVSATASGIKAAQGTVVHALYGVGTDLTVTKAPPRPKTGQAPPGAIMMNGGSVSGGGVSGGGGPAGTTVENFQDPDLGTLGYAEVAQVARLRGVQAAAGGFTLNDFKVTIPAGFAPGSGSASGSAPSAQTFSLDGVEVDRAGLGPLSAGKISSGRGLSAADAHSDVAVVDSGYATARRLRVGSVVPHPYPRRHDRVHLPDV